MAPQTMKQTLISVVVPVYNVHSFLTKCVDSILIQSYKNLEIILVDDGSTDGSAEECDALQKKDDRIKVVHKQNGGLASARNAGINIAHGEYIGFIDSDDWIEPDMYESLLNTIFETKCRLAVCRMQYVYDNGNVKTRSKLDAAAPASTIFNFDQAITEMNSYRLFDMSACTKLFDISLFDNIRFPDGKLSEDFFVMPFLFELAKHIAFIDQPFYNYFQRVNSISKSKKINFDFEEAAKQQMDFLDAKYPELKVVGHAAYASSVLTVYNQFVENHMYCDSNTLKHFKTAVRENKKYIHDADFWSVMKKSQFTIFLASSWLYRISIRLYHTLRKA